MSLSKNRFLLVLLFHVWLNVNEIGIDYDEEKRLYKNLKNWGYVTLAGEFYVLTQEGYAAI
ncbi:hypothetical protein DQM68_19785 (plasmid) [Leptospira mayottensis]|nr:hypothetical protein DQM68_19785 [Leptospira mayottensis]